MASAIGLRHPASASCLGRHLRLAGRCPNNSSLFPPLAAVVVVALCAYSAERLFLFVVSNRLRAFRNYFFTGGVVEGNSRCSAAFCESAALRGNFWQAFNGLNSLSQNLTVLPAPSGREPLAWRESFLLHLNFNSETNGVRPLRLCFANPPLPKGEASALPEASSLCLIL